ncbi:stage II sporulation protein R [Salipaludibacillus aurantiacus]|uniref:Stage II sporulation protein R n=1 Tax=Salipaludibacillus aurantiacus TaxID=1601833 RepID=A0A1H9VCF0_9BACI|nr:stage II sporulation protein R [Salipaludibacillus aurantiacus]SES19362.1 stage II sporulation protein R [Salipaludibacillus aurantiacus]
MWEKVKHIFKEYKKNAKMPLYFIFILSMFLMSWEAHFFYPAYQAHSTPLTSYNWADGKEDYIPEESIRLRIKSNSNSPADQQLKLNIRNEVNRHVSTWTSDFEDLKQARAEIENRMPELQTVIQNELDKMNVSTPFNVSLKEGVDFPTKQYGKRIYPAGEYEAVFVEIGDGLGDNWWCVLFPPLCFVDMGDSKESAESENTDVPESEEEVEVSFFVVEVVQSLWGKITSA